MLSCRKCLTGRTDAQAGDACSTPGCDGVLEEEVPFSALVDELPEPMTCPRRMQEWGPWPQTANLDRWQKFKSNGNRVCSFCGSLHPDDMFELVRACANAPEDAAYGSVVEIEPSDKNYKVYVQQPGVRNAHEGGIKFYMQHLPRDAEGKLAYTQEQNYDYGRAVAATKARFARYLAKRREDLEARAGGSPEGGPHA